MIRTITETVPASARWINRKIVGADDSVGPLSGCRDIVALVVGADAHIGPQKKELP